MTERRVVILGGYGVFGRHITENLSTVSDIRLTIAGFWIKIALLFEIQPFVCVIRT